MTLILLCVTELCSLKFSLVGYLNYFHEPKGCKFSLTSFISCACELASFPGLSRFQFLIACSMQKQICILQVIKNWGRPGNEAMCEHVGS